MSSNGRYVFVPRGHAAPPSGVVIDDLTDRRRVVQYPAGCSPIALGGRYLLFGCGPAPQALLYDLTTGGWRTVQAAPAVISAPHRLGNCDSSGCDVAPSRIGTHWIDWSYSIDCGTETAHCAGAGEIFQGIDTGQVEESNCQMLWIWQ